MDSTKHRLWVSDNTKHGLFVSDNIKLGLCISDDIKHGLYVSGNNTHGLFVLIIIPDMSGDWCGQDKTYSLRMTQHEFMVTGVDKTKRAVLE